MALIISVTLQYKWPEYNFLEYNPLEYKLSTHCHKFSSKFKPPGYKSPKIKVKAEFRLSPQNLLKQANM